MGPAKEEPAKEGEDAAKPAAAEGEAKCSTGRNIVGIMMLLTLPTRTMSLRSSLASPGNTQRLSPPRRSLLRRERTRPSQQPRKGKPRRARQRPRERLLRKEKLLLPRAKLLPQRSREMCDSSSSCKGKRVSQSRRQSLFVA